MSLKVNEKFLDELNFKGRGGKEQDILLCFQNHLVRQNGILYDCIDLDDNEKYELKKQKNLQWFDPRKYFDLSEEDQKITMIFLIINEGGLCDMIASIPLGDFVHRAFTDEQLQDADNYAKKHPKDQIKSGINVREFIKKHYEVMKIIWNRNSEQTSHDIKG